MSDSAQAPGSSHGSPPTAAGGDTHDSPPDGGGSSHPTPPTSSTPPPSSPPPSPSAPPPNSSPPPSPPPSPPQSPPPILSPPSNSGSPSPSPPLPSPPPSSPKSSPPPNSVPTPVPNHNPSPSSSPPPSPSSQGPPAAVFSPPPPNLSHTPPTGTPPSGTPPSSERSTPPHSGALPAQPPSNQSPPPPVSGGTVPTPPAQILSPPLASSPPVNNSSPVTTSNSTPSTGTSPTSSTSSTPTSITSQHVPSPSAGGNSTTNSSSESSKSSGSTGTGSIVGVTVAGVVIIAFVAFIFLITRRRKRRATVYAAQYMPPNNFSGKSSDGYYYGQQHTGVVSGQTDGFYSQPTPSPHGMGNSHDSQMVNIYAQGTPDSSGIGGAKSWFTYEELMEITNGFSRQNVLGEGGFGCVYKGWLPDGRVVAVKQLKAGSGQGEREFQAEVEIISRVHHRHLVSLVGYCISDHQRLLIYEFVPNKTLEHHLHGKGMPVLDWTKRLKIALGAARGLAYLHEDCHPKIIHRDIKSANILLDDVFEAQVADFGLAKLTNDTNTHVSTRVMGTFGYMAPEYASSGKLTDKSDVFSFGVVLLELITGRKPVDATQPLGDESLVEWARPHLVNALETGNFGELVDTRLDKNYVESEMFRMIEAAAACVRHSAPKRPRMMQVARALDCEGENSDLSNGVKYGQSTVYDSGQYNQDIMRFRRMAFGSGDSKEFETYSGDYTSKEISPGPSTLWQSGETSSDYPSGESETRAMNARAGERRPGEVQGGYGGHRFS